MSNEILVVGFSRTQLVFYVHSNGIHCAGLCSAFEGCLVIHLPQVNEVFILTLFSVLPGVRDPNNSGV